MYQTHLIPILVLWASLTAACGSQGSDGSPCDGVDCGWGRCGVSAEGPVCLCGVGYHDEDLRCVPDGDPCRDVTCTDHGRCARIGFQPVCICDEGYHALGLDCVLDDDPCWNVDCSDHGICGLLDGEAVCICDPGYVEAGLSCLPPDDPCRDIVCGFYGECVVEEGEAVCVCEEGYVPVDLRCEYDPCHAKDCSGHGRCVAEGWDAWCICDVGYYSPEPEVCAPADDFFVDLCTIDGWCRQNPWPTGEDLHDLWSSGPDDVWLVGGDGTLLWWDGEAWSLRRSGSGQDLHAIWGTAPDDVWIVGGDADGAVILRGEGLGLRNVSPALPDVTLLDVWGDPASDVRAVGRRCHLDACSAVVLSLQADEWVEEPTGHQGTLRGVWSSADGPWWAVGHSFSDAGEKTQLVMRRQPDGWVRTGPDGAGSLTSIWGSSRMDAWAVGTDCHTYPGECLAYIAHHDGSQWTRKLCMGEGILHDVYGTGPDRVWAVGARNVGGAEQTLAYVVRSARFSSWPPRGP